MGYIVKIDHKNNMLRLDLYKAHSIRISGRCKIDFKMDSTSSVIRNKIDNLILQMDKEFNIEFKKNTVKNIRAWLKANIDMMHIRSDIDDDIVFEIVKLLKDKAVLVRD